jgi:hypothetical protein
MKGGTTCGRNMSRFVVTQKTLFSKYHMLEESFNKLVDLLAPQLHVDGIKSRNCTGGIQPKDKRMMVAAGLRWGALPIGDMCGQGPLGNLGFVPYDGLEYDINEGEGARRLAIVNELEARDIRRPHRTL